METSIRRECLKCKSVFDAQLKEIKRGFGKFCNRKCAQQFLQAERSLKIKSKHNVNCAWCNKSFYKKISELNKSKSKLYFCCRGHKDLAQRIGGIEEIQPSHYGDNNYDYRIIVFRNFNKPKICERCGFDKNEAAIVVHHKDRDRTNNSIDNLEVLCCNCHAIEHFGGIV